MFEFSVFFKTTGSYCESFPNRRPISNGVVGYDLRKADGAHHSPPLYLALKEKIT
jgi:hypothetical protein